jgi:hypothetical protein
MLTKNGYAAMAAKMLSTARDFSVRSSTGSTVKLYPASGLKPASDMKYLQTYMRNGVVLGTGATPANLNDYKLAGDAITTFTYTASVSTQETDKGYECTALYTITNSGTAAFTIAEIGLFGDCYTNDSSSNGCFMIDRTVLDIPVTIPAGGIGQVTYTIRMNYPTA